MGQSCSAGKNNEEMTNAPEQAQNTEVQPVTVAPGVLDSPGMEGLAGGLEAITGNDEPMDWESYNNWANNPQNFVMSAEPFQATEQYAIDAVPQMQEYAEQYAGDAMFAGDAMVDGAAQYV